MVQLDAVDDEVGLGTWEPFACFYDPDLDTQILVVKGLFEVEGERSSTKPENVNLAGNEPDRGE
jgi:hypothetical protein